MGCILAYNSPSVKGGRKDFFYTSADNYRYHAYTFCNHAPLLACVFDINRQVFAISYAKAAKFLQVRLSTISNKVFCFPAFPAFLRDILPSLPFILQGYINFTIIFLYKELSTVSTGFSTWKSVENPIQL